MNTGTQFPKRPIRAALITFVALSLLVGISMPFQELEVRDHWPWAFGYCAMLAVASVGLARGGRRVLFFIGVPFLVAICPATIGIFLMLRSGVASDVGGVCLQVSLYLLYASGVWILYWVWRGWTQYFQSSHEDRLRDSGVALRSAGRRSMLLIENPYQSPSSAETAEPEGFRRSALSTAMFTLASIPAAFLPVAFVVVIAWTVWLFASSGSLPQPHPSEIRTILGWAFIYADLSQLPLYMVWALVSQELSWKHRLTWCAILYVGNAFTIPLFLYAKYVGKTDRLFGPKSGLGK